MQKLTAEPDNTQPLPPTHSPEPDRALPLLCPWQSCEVVENYLLILAMPPLATAKIDTVLAGTRTTLNRFAAGSGQYSQKVVLPSRRDLMRLEK